MGGLARDGLVLWFGVGGLMWSSLALGCLIRLYVDALLSGYLLRQHLR